MIHKKNIPNKDTLKSILNVSKFNFSETIPSFKHIEEEFDHMNVPFHPIRYHWPQHPSDVLASFRIAYSTNEIFIQYKVKEKSIRALEVNDETGSPWHDSCVEFFLIPGNDNLYYNIECNCIGTCLIQSGENRDIRKRYTKEITRKIRRKSSLGTSPFEEKTGSFEWFFIMAIPVSIFSDQNTPTLEGKTIRANFYKCGDKLSKPHWLTWNPVQTEIPSFHQPEFFGLLHFEN